MLLFGLFAYSQWRVYHDNRVTVDPGNRERLVIRDLAGRLDVLGPGEHYLPAWWTEFQRVNINRKAVEATDVVKALTGVQLDIVYRYDIIAGRRYSRENGQLRLGPTKRIDDASQVNSDDVIEAVTRIEYSEHEAQIAQRVRFVTETVMASFTDNQLLTPNTSPVHVPRLDLPVEDRWMYDAVDPETDNPIFPQRNIPIETVADLYDRLGKLIELRVNFLLRFLGINIVSFHISDLKHHDPIIQGALELASRNARLREATANDGLSPVERLAVGTNQFGMTVIASRIANMITSFLDGRGTGGNQPPSDS
jgi:hypothetical protein